MELIINKTHVQEFKIRRENHQLLTNYFNKMIQAHRLTIPFFGGSIDIALYPFMHHYSFFLIWKLLWGNGFCSFFFKILHPWADLAKFGFYINMKGKLYKHAYTFWLIITWNMYRNLVTFVDYFNSIFRDLLLKKSLNLWHKVSKYSRCAKCHTKQKSCCDHFFWFYTCGNGRPMWWRSTLSVHGCGLKILGWVP
jgi:hypothetical protein